MEKNQQFFDPYNFNMQNANHIQMQNDMSTNPLVDPMQQVINPAMYYEQQYMYYKYLTQMLEYKIKLKEWENLNRDKK